MIPAFIRALRVSVVALCCIVVGVTGGGVAEGIRAPVLEVESSVEPRAEKTSDRRFGQHAQIAPSNTTQSTNLIRVDVRANGSARWTVQYRLRLNNSNETAAFEALSSDIRTNPASYRDRFGNRLTDPVASAEVQTGREMTIQDVRVNASRQGDLGVITYTFEWRNFAATNGRELRIGDALTGIFLDNETRLSVSWPEGYSATTIRPDADEQGSRSVTWAASTSFSSNEPSIAIARNAANTTSGGSNAGEQSGGGGPTEGIGLVEVLAAGTALLLVLGAIVAWDRRREDGSGNEPSNGTDSAGTGTVAETVSVETEDEEQSTTPDPSLLSNEERVLRTLDELGGRAKQQQVVAELGWTDARTSQVVSRLRDDGLVEGFRLGRENVLMLPEEEASQSSSTDTDSP